MEYQDVVTKRRMIRRYQPDRPVPREIIDRILRNAVRAPSAGFAQGWGFLVLDTTDAVSRFRQAATPAANREQWFAAKVSAPAIVIPMANKDAYLERYAMPDKGFTDRSDDWWPAPYWDIDTGFATMLILLSAVDQGLGACFFGIPQECLDEVRKNFGIPVQYRPIGAISIGYPADQGLRLGDWRLPLEDVVRYDVWEPPR
jgi:nitroreductase